MSFNTQSYVATPPYTPTYNDGCVTINSGARTQYLIESDKKISKLLAKNLYNFAKEEVILAGLEHILSWKTTIVCINAEEMLEHRKYTVDFENDKETIISLVGIHVSKNRPTLHYGFEIQT